MVIRVLGEVALIHARTTYTRRIVGRAPGTTRCWAQRGAAVYRRGERHAPLDARLILRLATTGWSALRKRRASERPRQCFRRIVPGIVVTSPSEQGSRLHRDLVRVRRHIIPHDEQRQLDRAHQITGHGEHEVRAVRVHAGQEFVDHADREVGTLLARRRSPALRLLLIEGFGGLGPEAARLRHGARDDALPRQPDEVMDIGPPCGSPSPGTPGAEVVHQPELIVGVGVPGTLDLQRPLDRPGLAFHRSAQIQRNSFFYRSIG